MKIDELMTKDVVAVEPETTLKKVASQLVAHRISGVPVVDAQRRVVGVVSEADILVKEAGAKPESRRILSWVLGGGSADNDKLEARTAKEAMTSPAITVEADKHVSQAARLMNEERIKRLPVVDSAGTLLGIVTRADLVRAFTRPTLRSRGRSRKTSSAAPSGLRARISTSASRTAR